MNNKKKEKDKEKEDKTIAEQNGQFRLILRGINLMESRNYDVIFHVVSGDGFANIFITPEDEKNTLRIYVDKNDLLKLHEEIAKTYVHLHDSDARKNSTIF